MQATNKHRRPIRMTAAFIFETATWWVIRYAPSDVANVGTEFDAVSESLLTRMALTLNATIENAKKLIEKKKNGRQ